MHAILDRIMDEALMDIPRFGGLLSSTVPVDVYQTVDDVVVKATMPGLKPEDINISITGESLTIEGEVEEELDISDERNVRFYVRERRYGSFYRLLTLLTFVER